MFEQYSEWRTANHVVWTRAGRLRERLISRTSTFSISHDIPTPEEAKAAKDKFDQEHLTLDTHRVSSGRDLAILFAESTMDASVPAFDSGQEAAAPFAALIDYLRDFRDCASDLAESDKLQIYEEAG